MVNPPACSSTTTYAAGISSSSGTSPFEQIMSMDAISSIVLEYLAVNPNQNNIYHRFSGLLEDSSMDEQRFQSLHHGQTRDAFLGAMRTFAYPAPKSSPLSQQREEYFSDESPGGRRRTRFGGWFSKPAKSMTTRDADNITTAPRSRMQDVLALCSVNRSIRTSIGESFFWESRFAMHFGCPIVVGRREGENDCDQEPDATSENTEAEEASLSRPMLLQQLALRMKSRFSSSSSSTSTLLPIPQRNSVPSSSSSTSSSSSSWLSSLCAFIGAPKGTTQRMEFFQRSLEQFSGRKNEIEEEERLPQPQQRRSRIFDPNARIVLVASLKDCTYEMTDFLRLAVSACSETNDVCPSDVSIQTHRVFVHDTDVTMYVTTCVVPYSPEPPCCGGCGGGSVQQQEGEDLDEDVFIFDVPVSTTKTMNISKDNSAKKKKNKPNRTVVHFVGFQLGPMNNVKLEEIVGSDIWCVVYLLDARHVFADTDDVSCPTSMKPLPTQLKRVELIELTHALGVHETLRRMDAHVFCFGSGMGAEVNAAPSLCDMQRYLIELRRMAWDNYWPSAAAAARGQPSVGEVATPSLDVSFSCLALPATIRRAMSRVVYC